MDFSTLAHECAPAVHVTTLAAVVRHESGFDPLAIGINSNPPRTLRPKTRQDATAQARQLIARGVDFDAGYGQINVRNWERLGLTAETIFDPCANLNAAQRLLVDCYQHAIKAHPPGQPALYATFSCYNTGNLSKGFKNGYVAHVLAAGGVRIPALQQLRTTGDRGASTQRPYSNKRAASSAEARSPPHADAFESSHGDAFASPSQDGFATGPPDAFDKATKPIPAEPFGPAVLIDSSIR
ncbi:lytic transglycosylase domain-containing protein [Achromobacter insuavis]|uniref:lytic transglycosylase domain-containing protein n=1 Tax=Achromobacter insuavis TaxID=1287735 RepID=UPI000A897A00|nr:lytic transglycosylase domain-containing protein [Achromobacter insuavis]